ncbi:MAG TPA: ABC transporter ATP-binding protein [Candidatus Bathyarchaeota archaeon]|nr:ABC transporter ATP-binding protein [Candidatus Bathyarchaeota archaeon]
MAGGESEDFIIETVGLTKVYRMGLVRVVALRDVNLRVRRGEFVAVMGPSGSGKSTLLNLLGALDRPTKGRVIVDGVDLSRLSDDELARFRNLKVGFVFQFFNLIQRTTVLRNVELPLIVRGVPRSVRVKRAIEVLERVGLGGKIYRKPNELSGGERQRVAIARALVNRPSIVLADEPTGNLDTKTGMEVVEVMRKMNRELGTTFVIVTHDPMVANATERIIFFKDGQICGEKRLRAG